MDRESAIADLITEALQAGDQITLRVQGTSMMPAIWPGDIVTISPASSHYPAVGEIAVIRLGNGIRAHRVIRGLADVSGKGLVTRGDTLFQTDPAVSDTAVLGTVTKRNGRPLRGGISVAGHLSALGRRLASIGPLWFALAKIHSLRRR